MASPQPLNGFLKSVESARYEDGRQLPGAAVESAYAFEEMKAYVLDRYEGVHSMASSVDTDGQVVDHIPTDAHPATRRWGCLATALDEVPPHVPEPYGQKPLDPRSEQIVHLEARRPVTAQGLPADTTPLYRTSLAIICRYPTLAAYLRGDKRIGPAAARAGAFPKRYATGEQDIDCLGGSSKVNVWSPFAAASFQATFSQQWYLAGYEGTRMQTVECGWHVDIKRYHSAAPHLFVFATRQNYDDGHCAYNEDGGVFRRATNPYVIPGTPLLVSQEGGSQVEYKMGFYLTNNAWWFYFDDHPIGCFPVSWFNNGPLTTKATRARFGGEVGSHLTLWPAMGSGRHASAGFGQAAYQRAATINPVGGGGVYSSLAHAGSVIGPCYSVEITNNSTSFDWGTYLFFGGPGGTSC
ncbi:neprosin family prolyl endopeptidase [Streptomyces atroolivaceus]|uniref:neprosin family prolyl endopeptidase n=1 Tax=Streptomyces atroolivaceus TaxID=66869 RepID=UPI00367D37A1